MEDLDLLMDVVDNIEGNTICALGDSIAIPVRSYLQMFRSEFEAHVTQGKCSFPAWSTRDSAPKAKKTTPRESAAADA